MIAFSALKNKDRVGLIMFTDRVEKYIPPRKGRSHVLRILREILCFKPEGKGTDIRGALEYLLRVQRKKGIVFLISDFQDKGYRKPMLHATRKHDLIAVEISDIREREIPHIGLIDLEDPETGELVTIDTSRMRFSRGMKRIVAERDTERKKLFKSLSMDVITLDTEKPVEDALVKFFTMRMKKFR